MKSKATEKKAVLWVLVRVGVEASMRIRVRPTRMTSPQVPVLCFQL